MSLHVTTVRIGLAFLLAASGAALAQESAPVPAPFQTAPATDDVAPAVAPGDAAAPPAAASDTPAEGAPAGASTPTGSPAAAGAGVSEPAAVSPGATDAGPSAATGVDGAQPAASAGAGQPLPAVAELDPALPHDLSPWGMFMAADWVVKAVMIGLVFASLVTWTVWLAKALELSFAKGRARRQVRRLEGAESLVAALAEGRRPLRKGPVAALARSAAAEAELSAALPAEGVKERVAVALQRIEARSGRQMARGTGLLATIGSTAPFVGLFGTVWGIMNSFIGIAETNTTNLAIVAPGIAEALLATGIGLVAAIPAVIIYNVFARSIAGYRAILADGSAAVLRHLSRDLDRRDAGRRAAPVPYLQPAE